MSILQVCFFRLVKLSTTSFFTKMSKYVLCLLVLFMVMPGSGRATSFKSMKHAPESLPLVTHGIQMNKETTDVNLTDDSSKATSFETMKHAPESLPLVTQGIEMNKETTDVNLTNETEPFLEYVVEEEFSNSEGVSYEDHEMVAVEEEPLLLKSRKLGYPQYVYTIPGLGLLSGNTHFGSETNLDNERTGISSGTKLVTETRRAYRPRGTKKPSSSSSTSGTSSSDSHSYDWDDDNTSVLRESKDFRNPCLVCDVDYYGNDVEKFESGVPSVRDCQERCQKNRYADFFTYVPGRHACYLKHSRYGEKRVTNEIMISGLAHCNRSGSVVCQGKRYTWMIN